MKFIWIYIVLFCGLIAPEWVVAQSQEGRVGNFTYEELPDLPAAHGDSVAFGYAGMFAGSQGDMLILAGGANFPEGLPWEGGEKKYSDAIYLLQKNGDKYNWVEGLSQRLPQPLAYGVAVSTADGLVLIGGENEKGAQTNVLKLTWDTERQKVVISALPDLPFPLTNAAGGIIGSEIYIAGGEGNGEVSASFLQLDISKPAPQWKQLPSWPGEARSHAQGVVQSNGEYPCFYLFGGRQKTESGISELYSDAYCYDPRKKEWAALSPISDGEKELTLSAGAAASDGASHILFYGGVKGRTFNALEAIYAQLDNEEDEVKRNYLISQRDSILNEHPGFSQEVLAYHTVTDSWHRMEALPFAVPVTTKAVNWGSQTIIPSGEVSPGRRTPAIRSVDFRKEAHFGWLNYTVLGVYLGLLVLMGFWVSRNQHSTDDYFKAGGRVPWWAAGISIFGTQLSAITFMAIPAKTFATDWTLFFLLMTIIMVAPVIIYVFLPFFRRLNITTAYEYLELRYNRAVRLIGSLLYTGLQLGRLGIVLLLPSLALSVVTGIDVTVCILIMGLLSILYTVLGGIEAVIWTDVIQVVVLLGGALVCLVFIFIKVDHSPSEIWELARQNGKTQIFDLDFDFTGTSFWVVLIGGMASNIVQYGSDQTVIQRYLTTKDEKTAANGILTGALMALPSALIFFSIGTALYLFYSIYPQEVTPAVENADSIFPFYIVTQLPQGVSGLLIAAVFAAAMSSLDSSMNSVATVITTDFYKKLFPKDRTGRNSLRFARGITVLVGLIGTGFALVMASLGVPSLWDQFNMIIGLFAGGLGGIFLIGMLSRKVNGNGALVGLVASGLIQILIKYYTPLSIHMYALTGLVSAVIFTYLGSLFFVQKAKINGLTIHSLVKKPKKTEEVVKEKNVNV